MLSRAAALTPLALLTAWSVAPGQNAAPLVREGKYFVLELCPGTLPAEFTARLADEALLVVEAAWPVFVKAVQPVVKPNVAPPRSTIRVHVDNAAFLAAVKQHSPDSEISEDTFVTPDGAALVSVWPPLSAKVFQQVGFPTSLRRGLVFAAAKQFVTRELGATADPWIVDLVGLGLLETVVNPRREFGVDYVYDAHRVWFADARRSRRITMLLALIGESFATSHGKGEYSSGRAVIAELLARTDVAWARKLLAKWRTQKDAGSPTDRRTTALESVLGKDWSKSQTRFDEMCRTMQPVWEEASPLFWRDGAAFMLAGSEVRHAAAYAYVRPKEGPYVLRGTFTCSEVAGAGAFRVILHASREGQLCVIFQATQVVISEWTAKQEWRPLFSGQAQLAPDRPTDFRIVVAKNKVHVSVDGREVLEWDSGERDMHDSWGVEVGDAVVRLEGLVCESLAPAKK